MSRAVEKGNMAMAFFLFFFGGGSQMHFDFVW